MKDFLEWIPVIGIIFGVEGKNKENVNWLIYQIGCLVILTPMTILIALK